MISVPFSEYWTVLYDSEVKKLIQGKGRSMPRRNIIVETSAIVDMGHLLRHPNVMRVKLFESKISR